ncbi:MAG: hypothetical protein ACREJR_01185 [Candidatus Rokuibacteriota bacterium]
MELAVFLLAVAFSYASISSPLSLDANTWARMALVFSIVERGEVNIDRFVLAGLTEDWAKSGGHFYAGKAPGASLLAVPVYFVQHRLQRARGVAEDHKVARAIALYAANLVATVAVTLVALALFWVVLERRFGAALAFALTGTWAVGSLALPYTVLFFGHQTAAAFFTIGMCLSLLELDRPGGPRPWWIALAGFAMGLAVISEYLAVALVGVWTVYLAWRTGLARRALGAWLLGGTGPALVAIVYHTVCYGSPFITAYSEAVLNPKFVPLAAWEAPSLTRLADLTVRPWRGLFYATPVFALMLVSAERLRTEGRVRPELWAAAAGVALYLGLLAALPLSYGGYCIGPRYFTPALPLATLLLAPAVRLVPALFAALAGVSVVMMFAASLTDPIVDERILDPFREAIFPALAGAGEVRMRNLFTFVLGLDLRIAFGAYLALWAGVAGWLAVRLRPR